MANFDLEAKITADASGYEAGVKKAEKASKKLSTSVSKVIQGLGNNGLVGALGAVGLASQGLTSTLGAVVKIARKVSETMNECTNAYKSQLIAERSLNTAINNNPFVTGESSKALLQFVSDMQKVSNYGDDELIPMMTNLISLGRTEAETMQIMSVAMDMSAGMGISLDSAITQLNATLNGSIGRLGQQNAELKGLTEEELEQGKAIEILGEKFKGLSSATADTSKQLQNIKGDFKEALGQFTLPSSDMWNRFWAGFYERGIEIINKINAYLDAQTIGKKLAGAITDQLKVFGTGDVGGRIDYIRNTLKVVTDEELLSLQNYLEGLAYISSDQEQILRRIKAETDARKQALIDQKAQAEASAKQKREEEEKLAKQKELEEQEKKNAEERTKALKLQSEWEDKLFAIRLENLEKTRDKELENEKLTQEEREAIVDFYGEQILAMKIKQIEKERDEALNDENLTEEAREALILYYENRITQAKDDEEKKRLKAKKKALEEEQKEEKKSVSETLKTIVEYTKQYSKKIVDTFKKVVSTIKNVISSVVNIFSKMFDFNIDDALDVVLQVEDSILTFFVETLPRLPRFVQSVMQSIRTLLRNLKNIIKRENISEAVSQMLKAVGDNLPELVSDLLDVLEKVVSGAVDGLINWLGEGGGFVTILNMILKIQQTIEKIVTDNIGLLADFLSEHVEDLADFISNSMMSANKTLPKLIQAFLKIITAIIEAIAKAFENDEFVKSIIDSIIQVTDAIIQALPKLITAIVKLIVNIISALIPYLPELILQLVTEIADALPGMIGDIVKALSSGIKQIFSKIFTFDFWIDVLSSMAGALGQIIKGAFSGIGSISGGGGGDNREWYKKTFDPFNLFWHANGTNNAQRGLSIVGEAGPELVRFNGGEQVLNNRNTNKALENMGEKTNNFNVTFNNLQDTTAFNMMQQLKAYNRQMAINGVI